MANQLLLDGNDDLISIDLHYQVKKSSKGQRQFRILTDEEAKKLNPEEGAEKPYDTLETKWKPQTWQTNNSLIKSSTTYNTASGSSELDWSLYQQNIFKFCLESWNVTDDQGRPIPPTIENVGMLPSNVARYLIQLYNESQLIDEDEKKE